MSKKELLDSKIEVVDKYINSSKYEPVKAIDSLIDVLIDYKSKGELDIEHDLFHIASQIAPLPSEIKFHIITKAWEQIVIENTKNKKTKDKSIGDIVIPENINVLLSELLRVMNITGRYTLSSSFSFGFIEQVANKYKKNTYVIKDNYNSGTVKKVMEKLYYLCNLNNVEILEDKELETADVNISLLGYINDRIEVDKWVENINYYKDKAKLIKNEVYNSKGQTQYLEYIEHSILNTLLNNLKDDGVLISLVPNGVLTNHRYANFRKVLREYFKLIGIIELPKYGLFDNTDINFSLLIIKNTPVDADGVFLAKFESNKFSEELDELTDKYNDFIKGVNV